MVDLLQYPVVSEWSTGERASSRICRPGPSAPPHPSPGAGEASEELLEHLHAHAAGVTLLALPHAPARAVPGDTKVRLQGIDVYDVSSPRAN